MQRSSRALICCAPHIIRLLAALLLLVVGDLNSSASAQNNWTGDTSSDWFTASNWSLNVVPNGQYIGINTIKNPTEISSGGGSVTSLYIGQSGPGQLTVTGAGSSLGTSQGYFIVGWSYHGKFVIEDGAVVNNSANTLSIGHNGGNGEAIVTGAGSTLNIGQYAGVVIGANGSLTIANQAVVNSVGQNVSSSGTLNIGAAPGDTPVAPGILNTPAVQTGGGVINFNHTDNNYAFAPSITGSGAVNAIAGTTIFTGANTYTGGLTVENGAIARAGVVDQAFGAGLLTVKGGGLADLANFNTTVAGLTGGGNVTLGSGTLTLNQDIATEFSGTISDSGGLVMNGTGILSLTGTNTYTGPTAINQGALVVDGSITSATNVASAGTLGGSGNITGAVTNSGTIAPGFGLTTAGAQLTINGNYTGNGGTLALNTVLGDNSSTTDQLIINGGTASGTTGIVVANIGGAGAQTTGNGIPIVVPTGGATIDAGAFGASGSVVPGAAAGPYQYLLFQGGDTGYYLASHCEGSSCPGPGPGPTPIYRPDVSIHSVLAGMARRQELATLGTFHDRNGDQRLATGAGNRTAAWGRLFGQMTEQSHSGTVSAHFDGSMGGLQAGVDAMQWVSPSGHQDRLGLFAAYARTTGDVSGHALGVPNRIAGRAELDGTSFGGYWTHLAPTGWYTDTVVMGTRFDGGGHSVVGTDLDVDGYGVTASVEGGYPIALGGGIRLEPQAQLVYSHINLDDVHDPYSHVAYHTPDALFGRLGVRLSADMLPLPMMLRPYLKANVWQDFTEADTLRFAHVHEITSRHRATTLELGGGVVAQLSQDVGLWSRLHHRHRRQRRRGRDHPRHGGVAGDVVTG